MRRVGATFTGVREISEDEFHTAWGVQLAANGDLLCFEDVRSCSPHLIWTVVDTGDDSDRNWYAVPGLHVVNRLGYVLTTKPWNCQTPPAIYFLDD